MDDRNLRRKWFIRSDLKEESPGGRNGKGAALGGLVTITFRSRCELCCPLTKGQRYLTRHLIRPRILHKLLFPKVTFRESS